MISLGIKTDPIETRYSYEWLFSITRDEGVPFIQLGSFFELYSLDDTYFLRLRELAEQKKVRIKSVFTAHRELGGFFYVDPFMEKVARENFERLIHVSSLLGADYCGSNPGAVYRDRLNTKEKGIQCYLSNMKELMHLASDKKLKGLTIEPMSSMAEPPATTGEMDRMIEELGSYHKNHLFDTVPVYLCGDISHGLVDKNFNIIVTNTTLFKHGLAYMAEFHFKNTDSIYCNTFGFSAEEIKKGIINLEEIKSIIYQNKDKIPVKDMVGYLEIQGPKTGRDYSDKLLELNIRESIRALKAIFG